MRTIKAALKVMLACIGLVVLCVTLWPWFPLFLLGLAVWAWLNDGDVPI